MPKTKMIAAIFEGMVLISAAIRHAPFMVAGRDVPLPSIVSATQRAVMSLHPIFRCAPRGVLMT